MGKLSSFVLRERTEKSVVRSKVREWGPSDSQWEDYVMYWVLHEVYVHTTTREYNPMCSRLDWVNIQVALSSMLGIVIHCHERLRDFPALPCPQPCQHFPTCFYISKVLICHKNPVNFLDIYKQYSTPDNVSQLWMELNLLQRSSSAVILFYFF